MMTSPARKLGPDSYGRATSRIASAQTQSRSIFSACDQWSMSRIYMESMQLTVYSAPWCRDCREAKRFLDRYNIPYTTIDIETTPGAAEEVIRRTGKRAIPQFVIDGDWVQPYRVGEGFLYEEMAKRLGID